MEVVGKFELDEVWIKSPKLDKVLIDGKPFLRLTRKEAVKLARDFIDRVEKIQEINKSFNEWCEKGGGPV